MKINVHAGHNPDGKIACGSVGLIKESTQARKVKDYVIGYLKQAGHTVYDCTVDDGKSQKDVLNKIVAKCNMHKVDLDISIHFNSGRNDLKGDDSIGGTEVLIYSFQNEQLTKVAKSVADSIVADGFKLRSDATTRKGMEGVKLRPELVVLNSTKSNAILIEACFVDDKDDIEIYNAKKMARAIVKGILNAYPEYKCITKQSINIFDSSMNKVGKAAKGSICIIDKVRFNGDLLIGRRKKAKTWIRLKYTNLA